MALCSSSCGNNAAVPRFPTGCVFDKRKGGIPNLIFISCNFRFAGAGETTVTITAPDGSTFQVGKITDHASWAAGVQHDMIRISPEGLGEKPQSTFTQQRVSSCRPEEIASETHVINFQSYQVDNDNFWDREYWNQVRTQFNKFRLLYWDCNENVFYSGDVTDPGFEFVPTAGPGYIIPQIGQTDNAYYEANLSFVYEGIPAIISVAGLSAALTIDVNT